MMPYTIKELDDVIARILKSRIRVVGYNRVLYAGAACQAAFIDEISGPDADLLREAMRDLSRAPACAFQPSDGIWPED